MTTPTSIPTAQVLTEGDNRVVVLPEGFWFTGTKVDIPQEVNEAVLSEKQREPAGNPSVPHTTDPVAPGPEPRH